MVIVAVVAWQGYAAYHRASLASQHPLSPGLDSRERHSPSYPPNERFSCDGRTHCSQMTSCEEATYFVNNCPGTKMDGDNDGVACESQWCGR